MQKSLSAFNAFLAVAAVLSISACRPTVNTISNNPPSPCLVGAPPAPGTDCGGPRVEPSKPQQSAVASGSENDDAVTSVSVDAPPGTTFTGFIVDLGAQFTRANICSGATIFGRAGTAVCGAAAAFGSMVHVDLTSRSERLIPKAALDHDGMFSTIGGAITGVTFTNTFKFKNGSTDCGITGTLEQRISDCSYSWDGQVLGTMGQSKWTLVSRKKATANNPREFRVWRDERTGLIWSSALLDSTADGGTNWCQASGNIENVSGVDCTPGSASGLQPATPVSMCTEVAGMDSTGFDGPKAGLHAEVEWHLPSRNERLQAEVNGLYFVLTPTEKSGQATGEWTSTTAHDAVAANFSDTPNAYVVQSSFILGLTLVTINRAEVSPGVRCVGRAK